MEGGDSGVACKKDTSEMVRKLQVKDDTAVVFGRSRSVFIERFLPVRNQFLFIAFDTISARRIGGPR